MTVSLLQWNIWTDESPHNILSQLQILNPDIICLQEVTQNAPRHNGMDVALFLARELEYFSFYATAHTKQKIDGARNQGNMILSRYPIVAQNHVFVQSTNQDVQAVDYSQEGRVLVMADIQLGNSLLKVATTHLSYTHRFGETESKRAEVDTLLKTINQFDTDFILTGDFNVTESSYLIAELNKKYQHCGPDFSQKTWTTKPFSYNGFTETELNWRLDYVFSSKDLAVKKSEIVQTDFSDHLPILVEISIWCIIKRLCK